MNTISKMLKSRTNWAILLMFVVGGFEAVKDVLPGSTWVLGLLGAMAVYFKLNPSQKYGA